MWHIPAKKPLWKSVAIVARSSLSAVFIHAAQQYCDAPCYAEGATLRPQSKC